MLMRLKILSGLSVFFVFLCGILFSEGQAAKFIPFSPENRNALNRQSIINNNSAGNVLSVVTACLTPAGGCPQNYSWDSASCTCQPQTNSTSSTANYTPVPTPAPTASVCSPPPNGCGSYYYWSTADCLCKPYPTQIPTATPTIICQPPAGGCASGTSWNYSYCYCRPYATPTLTPTPVKTSCQAQTCPANYYWSSSLCTCVASALKSYTAANVTPTPCSSPASGCGADYFWSLDSCSCKPYPTPTSHVSTCASPSSGCGAGYYWNNDACSCRPYPTPTLIVTVCSPPSSGCSSNYYWDSSSCSCKINYAAYCQPPSSGCGQNSYWDSSSCQCKIKACMPPLTGCDAKSYWDYLSCSCKNFEVCSAPVNGCPVNYSWDITTCSCKPKSSCAPPPSGCGLNSYWDSASCSCKGATVCLLTENSCPQNTLWDEKYCRCKSKLICSAPQNGCGANYRWDETACTCLPLNTASLCHLPVSGCGNGWYWDQNTCACKSESDHQTAYSPDLTDYTLRKKYDRFAAENPEKLLCIKSLLNKADYEKIRYTVPDTQAKTNELVSLNNKIKSCWGKVEVAGSKTILTDTSFDNELCLKNSLGEKAYREIYLESRPPSYEEYFKFAKCFPDSSGNSSRFLTNNQEIPPVIESCLKNALTPSIYRDVKNGKIMVPFELRDFVSACFGMKNLPFKESEISRLPDDINSCLLTNLGAQRVTAIISNHETPTKDEKILAAACFARLNSTQKKLLPPPVEQIAFLEQNSGVLKLTETVQEKTKFENKTAAGKIILKGKALPNQTVSLYVFSDPIVVTTKADANGDWVYELNKPFTSSRHLAYAASQISEENSVRSEIFNFSVIAAESDTVPALLNEDTTVKKALVKFLWPAVIAVFAAISLYLYLLWRKRNEINLFYDEKTKSYVSSRPID